MSGTSSIRGGWDSRTLFFTLAQIDLFGSIICFDFIDNREQVLCPTLTLCYLRDRVQCLLEDLLAECPVDPAARLAGTEVAWLYI